MPSSLRNTHTNHCVCSLVYFVFNLGFCIEWILETEPFLGVLEQLRCSVGVWRTMFFKSGWLRLRVLIGWLPGPSMTVGWSGAIPLILVSIAWHKTVQYQRFCNTYTYIDTFRLVLLLFYFILFYFILIVYWFKLYLHIIGYKYNKYERKYKWKKLR